MNTTTDTLTTASKVKKGEYVRFSNTDTAPVWVKGDYDRSSKKHSFSKADDMNREVFLKSTAKVFVGFEY
jgi:hypothetical protein